MKIDYATVRHPAFEIAQEALSLAIVELNSMSPCDAVVMTRSGVVKAGYDSDADTLCSLIPAGRLARQLTADGLSSYTGKELRKWADAYDRAPLQARVDAAMQQWLEGMHLASELLPLLRLYPGVAQVETDGNGCIVMTPEEDQQVPETARMLAAAAGCC